MTRGANGKRHCHIKGFVFVCEVCGVERIYETELRMNHSRDLHYKTAHGIVPKKLTPATFVYDSKVGRVLDKLNTSMARNLVRKSKGELHIDEHNRFMSSPLTAADVVAPQAVPALTASSH